MRVRGSFWMDVSDELLNDKQDIVVEIYQLTIIMLKFVNFDGNQKDSIMNKNVNKQIEITEDN